MRRGLLSLSENSGGHSREGPGKVRIWLAISMGSNSVFLFFFKCILQAEGNMVISQRQARDV